MTIYKRPTKEEFQSFLDLIRDPGKLQAMYDSLAVRQDEVQKAELSANARIAEAEERHAALVKASSEAAESISNASATLAQERGRFESVSVSRAAELTRREIGLADLESAKHRELDDRAAELAGREDRVVVRERSAEEIAAAQIAEKGNLDSRAQTLLRRETASKAREAAVDTRERSLDEREANVRELEELRARLRGTP